MPEPSELLSHDPLLDRVARELRRPVVSNRGVDRAMAALRAERRRRLGWQLAAAAAILLAVGGGTLQARRDTKLVRFAVHAPDSRQVALVGDFNDWNRGALLLKSRDGEWSVTLRLRPGRYRYSFFADGERWIADGAAPAGDDDFDTPTSVVTVAN